MLRSRDAAFYSGEKLNRAKDINKGNLSGTKAFELSPDFPRVSYYTYFMTIIL